MKSQGSPAEVSIAQTDPLSESISELQELSICDPAEGAGEADVEEEEAYVKVSLSVHLGKWPRKHMDALQGLVE